MRMKPLQPAESSDGPSLEQEDREIRALPKMMLESIPEGWSAQ